MMIIMMMIIKIIMMSDNNSSKMIIIMIMMMIIIMLMMIMKIITVTALKGAIQDLYNLLTAPRAASQIRSCGQSTIVCQPFTK